MKNFIKVCCYVLGTIFVLFYIAFLFVIPRVIKLDAYKPQIQKLVFENTGLNINYDDIKVITTPFLEAGVRTDNLKVTLPDNSEILSTDTIKAKIFLPSILWFTVKVSGVDIVNPKITADISEDGEQYKVVRVYENLVNTQRKEKLEHPEKYITTEPEDISKTTPIDISKIRFNIQNIKLKNYIAIIDDKSSGHKLTLKGEDLKLGCNNLEKAALQTYAQILSDEDVNITAKIDIDTFLPEFKPKEKEEEDLEAIYAIPFVNPVSTYRTYNLKSNIDTKLKLRQNKKSKYIKANGHLNIENTKITLSGIELPESNFKLLANDDTVTFDSNLYVTEVDNIVTLGKIRHGKHPYIGFNINSSKIYFANLLEVIKAYLNTAQIKTDINNMSANGYFIANAGLQTDFENLQSAGAVVVRDGNITDKNIGLIFDDIRVSLSLDNNIIKIGDTHLLINNKPLDISGQIQPDSVTDLKINAVRLPLSGLYKAFAPKDMKKRYDLNSGFLSIDAKANGKLRELLATLKLDLNDLTVKEKSNLFTANNNNLRVGLAAGNGEFNGRVINNGFILNLPLIHSVIKNDNITIEADSSNINIQPSNITFNKQSVINISGTINELTKGIKTNFTANGNIHTNDLGILVGEIALPYFEKTGVIPVKAKFESRKDDMEIIAQAKADNSNHFTPVIMKDLEHLQSIFQVKIDKKGNTLKLERSGLFVKPNTADFSDNLVKNTLGSRQAVNVRAIITNLNTQPFISLFRVDMPHPMQGSVAILKKSKFNIIANLTAHGKPQNPVLSGKVLAENITVPEINSKVQNLLLILGAKNIDVKINKLDLGGTIFNLSTVTNWTDILDRIFYNVNVTSNYIDVNKIVKFGDSVAQAFPNPKETIEKASDKNLTMNIPLEVRNGHINFKKITVDKIILENTESDIVLKENVIYLNKLKTKPLDGDVAGKVSMNLVTSDLFAELSGKNFDIEKILLDVMNMKDMLSGNMNFFTRIRMSGTDIETQMKTLKGFVDFNIKDGQLGPFGKLENMIMAENIRENAFFSSTIGSLITNLVTFDTSRYNELYGHLRFLGNGNVDISPIKSQGNVLSMYIAGKMNIIDNTAEMKVRGKLASMFADKLGPLANINPINIVKKTPGLNVALVKAFALFCEEISEEEMKALPHLGEGKSDDNATKFQIRLKGNLNKPLSMIKSFKWLVLDSEMQSAKEFVDTLPVPEAGEEGMSVEELIQLRKEQAEAKAAEEAAIKAAEEKKLINRLKKRFKKVE